MTVVLEPDVLTRDGIRDAVGAAPHTATSFDELTVVMRSNPEIATVILGPSVDTDLALDFAERMRTSNPTLGVVLVRRRIDAVVLAAGLKAGVREVLSERDLPGLAEAVTRSRALTGALRNPGELGGENDDSDLGHLFTVFSPKGGAGKTTFAVNVSVGLAARGMSTLLIDLDLAFGDVPISLGLRPEHTFEEAVAMGERLDAAALRRLVTPHESGLHVLAPPTDPGVSERVTVALVRRMIAVAMKEYQYVIVDTAPQMDERSLTVMENSDTVFMLTTLDIPSLKNLKIALETLRVVNFPMERVRVIMNRADSKVGLDAGEVQKTLGVPVVAFIPSSRLVPASTNRGVPILTDQPKSPVSAAFHRLIGHEIIKESPHAEKRGLFGKRSQP
ncbi:MAG: AAA family ATPase [Candidatus Nanopelagicales bacterium]